MTADSRSTAGREPPGVPAAAPLVLVAVASTALFAWILWRTAWVSDDAFITLRTIDNAVNGFGLRWNIAERVQTYTHPAWLLVLLPFYAITREPYFTTLAVQAALSLATVFVLLRYVATATGRAAVAAAVLISSKAMTDFSTSGLENPLSHAALLATFLAWRNGGRHRPWLVALASSVVVLCRLDLLLLIGPLLIWIASTSLRTTWRPLALGLSPLLAWEAFAVVYYGTPVPNTALAKVATGIPAIDLVRQGGRYWWATFVIDPVTVAAIVGAALVVMARRRGGAAFAAGSLLYAGYLVRVGGDFMSGRFLTPLLCWSLLAAIGLPPVGTNRRRRPAWLVPAALAALIVATGLAGARTAPLSSGPRFGQGDPDVMDVDGVVDERRFYFQTLGLGAQLRGAGLDHHPWVQAGKAARLRNAGANVAVAGNVGLFGYHAGPGVHVIDRNALCDPLLARLPARTPWRIGHFTRDVPAGYVDTIRQHTNVIADPGIHALYDRVAIVTRGSVWTAARWRSIAALLLE
ncbi:MAG: hypothetical protein IT184_07985 [Acidobacteria bacterium]|nr:hypothetical protein [Acidobacteriota bacterium]